jgi:hypothetical protein
MSRSAGFLFYPVVPDSQTKDIAMSATRVLKGGGFLLPLLLMIELAMGAYAQTTAQSQVPEIHQLMKEVLEHQRDVDKPMENYAYTSVRVTEDLDSKGKVTKTERNEFEIFFVNGRGIARKEKNEVRDVAGRDFGERGDWQSPPGELSWAAHLCFRHHGAQGPESA